MATSMKMDDETKSRLKQSQAEIRLETGARVAQQEVLTRLVENVVESKTGLTDSFREERVPLSASKRERSHDGMVSSGITTTEEDIGGVLYG